MKPIKQHRYWCACGWRGWRARRLTCQAAGEHRSVLRGRLINRVRDNADIIAEIHEPINKDR